MNRIIKIFLEITLLQRKAKRGKLVWKMWLKLIIMLLLHASSVVESNTQFISMRHYIFLIYNHS